MDKQHLQDEEVFTGLSNSEIVAILLVIIIVAAVFMSGAALQ